MVFRSFSQPFFSNKVSEESILNRGKTETVDNFFVPQKPLSSKSSEPDRFMTCSKQLLSIWVDFNGNFFGLGFGLELNLIVLDCSPENN